MKVTTVIIFSVIQFSKADINQNLFKRGKIGDNDGLSKIPRLSHHFYVNAYDPERDGFCERIARQTARLVGKNQYNSFQRKRKSYFPIDDQEFRVLDEDYVDSYYPDHYSDIFVENENNFNEYVDVDKIKAAMYTSHIEGRRGVIRIDKNDKRPKCQPVGAQIDCRCGPSLSLPAGGWCALWKCAGIQEIDTIGRWQCASWC